MLRGKKKAQVSRECLCIEMTGERRRGELSRLTDKVAFQPGLSALRSEYHNEPYGQRAGDSTAERRFATTLKPLLRLAFEATLSV